jgi:hypothetical protein
LGRNIACGIEYHELAAGEETDGGEHDGTAEQVDKAHAEADRKVD